MKKILLTILLIALVPFVYAEEPCSVVTGTGTNIGDEIKCGTEYFYIVSNDGTYIKALAKYNLNVGYKLEATESFVAATSREAIEYCDTNYGINYQIQKNATGDFYCLASTEIDVNSVKQDPSAIGDNQESLISNGVLKIEFMDISFDVNTSTTELEKAYLLYKFNIMYFDSNTGMPTVDEKYGIVYLTEYEEYLKSLNLELIDMNIISIDELDELIKNISNSNLPLTDWVATTERKVNTAAQKVVVGQIKSRVDDEYKWLYSTTYWISNMYYHTIDSNYIYYVDTLGNLNIDNVSTSAGAGIRPLITINVNQLKIPVTPNKTPDTIIKVENPRTGIINLFILLLPLTTLLSIIIIKQKRTNI